MSEKNTVSRATRSHRAAKTFRSRAEIEPLLPKIKQAIAELYGDRLVDVILYGSFARGKATEDSDIDIGVVLRGEVEKVKEIIRIGDAIYELGLEAEELISVFPVEEKELRHSKWPLYYWIKKEGITL